VSGKLIPHFRLDRGGHDKDVASPRVCWCVTHKDFAWRYDDGSVACFGACVLGTTTDECEVIGGALSLTKGVLEQSRKGENPADGQA
jgi:hypothetical protein